MYAEKKIFCIIPARAGSKRLPGKNIKPLHGKPLIAYAIEAALGSRYIDRVVVSTESEELADVARHYGADVPFMRPSELATDTATSVSVLQHAINGLHIKESDLIVLVQPTSPLVQPQDIDAAIEKLVSSGAPTCVSVSESGKLNGAVYVARWDALMLNGTVNDTETGVTIVMPEERSVDIDTEADFARAELFIEKHGTMGGGHF